MMKMKMNVWKVWMIVMVLLVLPGMAGRVMAEDWIDPTRLPTSGGVYRLTTDVTMRDWSVNGYSASLDLNGHTVTITGGNGIGVQMDGMLQITDAKGGGIIRFTGSGALKVTKGILNLDSGTIEGNIHLTPIGFQSSSVYARLSGGTIRGSVYFEQGQSYSGNDWNARMEMLGGTITCSNDSCVQMNDKNAVFNMKGGSIKADRVVRTVNILSGTFRQSGGEISLARNITNGTEGVVLGNESTAAEDGSFLITGGSIRGFTGVSGIDSGYAVYLYNGGSVTMTGGEISGNGVGVRLDQNGAFTMTGGTVSGNSVGVFVSYNAKGLNISGSPKITGNSGMNVRFLPNNQKINISGSGLNSDARIGFWSEQISGTPVNGVFTSGLNGNYTPGVFTSDVNGYSVGMNADGEMIFGKSIYVRFNVGGKIQSQNLPTGSLIKDLPQITVPADKVLDGWYLRNNYTGDKFNFDRDTVYSSNDNLNLYARIMDAAAAIGETKYATLPQALEAAQPSETVTLLRDVTLDAPIEIKYPITTPITLDLNGKTLTRGLTSPTENGHVIHITAARTLTIKDSSAAQTGRITGGNTTGNGGGILIGERGSLVLEGGEISGNTAAGKGSGVYSGVYIANNAWPLVVRGGKIINNTSTNLYLESGKTISIHQAPADGTNIGVTLADGEGVFAESTGGYNSGRLSAADVKGFVSDNSAYAAGVKADGKAYLGAPVTVTFNTAGQAPAPAALSVPTGSLITRPELTVPSGMAFSGWYKESSFTNKWNFNSDTVDAALTLYAKIVDAEPVAAIGTTNYNTVQDALDEAVSGDTVTLLKNVDIDETLHLATGKNITLDMAEFRIAQDGSGRIIQIDGGLTLTGNGTLTGGSSSDKGGAVYLYGGSLTLISGTITGNSSGRGGAVYAENKAVFTMEGGTISGNNADSGGGAVYLNIGGNDTASGSSFLLKGGTISGNTTAGTGGAVYANISTVTMEGGMISGNTASYGGAVYLRGSSGYASFTLKDGEISGNTATTGSGGAVYTNPNSEFIMEGGTLSDNEAAQHGGAVYAANGTGNDYFSFTMKGGTISGNTAGGKGGALAFSYEGSAVIEGGTISGNSAGESGGGIYAHDVNNNSNVPANPLTIRGGSITGNTVSGAANNVYVPAGKYLSLADSLPAGTSIGIIMENGRGVFGQGQGENGKVNFNPADYFSADDSSYGVGFGSGLDNEKAVLGYKVSFDPNGGSGTMADLVASDPNVFYGLPENQFTREGYAFGSWNTAVDGSGESYAATDMAKFPQSMTLYAQWLTVWQWVQAQLDAGVTSITLPGNATAGPDDQALTTKPGTAVTINLNGFTLDRGNPDYSTDFGGGVVRTNDGSVIVAKSNLTLTGPGTITGGNKDGNGGGIRVEAGNLTIGADVTISGNKASGSGGGIYMNAAGSSLSLTIATVSGNSAGNGGGICLDAASSASISGSTISGNTASDSGGGINAAAAVDSLSIDFGSLIENNIARTGDGGGIYSDAQNTTIGNFESMIAVGSPLSATDPTVIRGNAAQNRDFSDGGGIYTYSGSLKIDKFCVIENNSAALEGGGIYTGANSNFVMEGGSITGNSTGNGGGGVYAVKSFTMSGGSITGNSAVSEGGGVYAYTKNTFQLSGKVQINGNTIGDSPNNVYLYQNLMINVGGSLEGASVGVHMSSPRVFTSGLPGNGDNSNFFSDYENYAVGLTGAGEATLTESYTVRFDVGSSGITAPADQILGSGVNVTEPTLSSEDWFYVEGWYKEATFQNKWDFATDTVSGNMTLYAKFLTVWQWVQHELDKGTTPITLPGDAAAGTSDGPLTIHSGTTIDLNGHNIDRGLSDAAAVANGNVITANGDLTLTDSAGGGTITGGNNTGNGGGIVMNSGFLTLWDVTISGNKSERHGGGIYFAVNGGYLWIEANAVIESNSARGSGGGIYAENVSIQKTDIRQAIIRKNSASMNGGGIYFKGTTEGFYIRNITISENSAGIGGGIYIETDGPITLGLAEITKNKAEDSGGGIFIEQAGDFTIHTVTVNENTAKNNGGGIYLNMNINSPSVITGETSIQSNTTENGNGGGIYFDNQMNVGISGKFLVSGNRSNSKENNIYLTSHSKFNISGTLDPDTRAGISMENPGVFTNSLHPRTEKVSCFFSDDPAYAVGLNSRGEAYLGLAWTVTFKLDKGGTSVEDPAAITAADGSRIIAPTVGNIPYGYGLEGWYTDNTYNTKWNFGDTVNGNMTLYARIREAVASLTFQQNTTLYTSVQDAINAGPTLMEQFEVTLLQDVTPEESITIDSKGVHFDLAGHTIHGTSGNLDAAVIEVGNGGFLVLRDSSSGQTGKIVGGAADTHGIYINSGATSRSIFTMEGGTIESCNFPAVFVQGNVDITMSGGRIIQNSAASGSDHSGGIYIAPDGFGGEFTLAGGNGAVSGNTNGDGKPSNVYLPGGLVIEVTAPLTGAEGSIGITMENGAGVFARAADTYNGGKLTEADAAIFFSDNPDYTVRLNGNGEAELVRAYTVNFDVAGHGTAPDSQKVVSGETVTEPVYTAPKEYILTGWYTDNTYTIPWNFGSDTVTDNLTLFGKVEEAAAAIGETGYLTVQAAVDAAQTGETVTLLKDVTISAPVMIASGKELTLDLSGHTLDRGLYGLSPVDGGNVITVNGTLTLTDSAGGGKVTGGNNSSLNKDGGGVIVNGTFTLKSGEITLNSALNEGGGVQINDGGTFFMEGGTISKNGATGSSLLSRQGGGVSGSSGSSFTMTGGTISENTAYYGGGVFMGANFTMTGGTITGNSACMGGGVRITDGTVSLEGGSISSNTVLSTICDTSRHTPVGSGVDFSSGNLSLKGTIQIKENSGDNLYIPSGRWAKITAAPQEGASVGVTLANGSGEFARGSGHTLSDADKAYFFSDDTKYVVGLNADKRLFLGKSYTVSFHFNTTDPVTGAMADQTFIEGEQQALTAHAFHRTGYGFTGWNTEPSPTTENPGTAYDDGEEITVTGDLTLYAQWALNKHTVTFIANDSEGSIRAEGEMHAEQFDYGTTQELTENAFTRTGYEFKGWNTVAAPTAENPGTPYADKASVTIEDDIKLYAQWEIITYTITYELNSGELPEGQTNPASYTVETDDFTLVNPVRTGYTFTGWNDGTAVAQSVVIVKNSTGNKTCTAEWTANNYTIRYEPNGGSGTAHSEDFTYDSEQVLAGWNLSGDPFERTGYRFTEWNTAADGSGTGYTMHEKVKNLTAEPNVTVTLYARWEPITYTVHFEANTTDPVTGSMADQTFTYDVSQALTANAYERSGYSFVGWNTAADGTGTNYTDQEELKNLSNTQGAVITLYAKWTLIPIHTVTFNPNGGTGNVYTQNVEEGTPTSLTPNTFTREGWTFAGWNTAADGSGTAYADKAAVTLSADQTLYAQWAAVTYSITYHLAGGSVSGTNPDEYTPADAAITLINPTRTGYSFSGWQGTGLSGTVLSVTIPTGSTGSREYTAVWSAVRYQVSYDKNSGEGTMGVQSFTYDTSQNLWPNSFTRTGFTFLGWNTAADGSGTSYGDGESVNNLSSTDGAVVTLYAQWTQNPTRTVTFDANDNSSRTNTQSVVEGVASQLSPNQFSRTHYTFSGWNSAADGSGDEYADEATVTLSADMTLYAQWTPVNYTIRFHANGGDGTMADQVVAYTPGVTQLNAHSFTREGYGFDRWNTASDGSGKFYNDGALMDITEDLDLYAQWVANVHTVTFLPNGGAGTMDAERFPYGSVQTLRMNAFEREGYEFTGWKDAGGTDYTDGQSVTISADLALTAQWSLIPYTIIYDLAGGTISGTNPGTYTVESAAITLINPTRTGYTFSGWQGAGLSGTVPSVTIPAGSTGDRDYTAVWTANTYTVAFVSNGGTGSMADQNFTYDVPQALSPLGFTREGFTFVGWYTNPDGTGTSYEDGESVHNLTDRNGVTVSLYAVWTEKPTQTITFEPNGGAEAAYHQKVIRGSGTALSPNQFTRVGYTFSGWNTAANGSGTPFAENSSVILVNDMTLYAQWEPIPLTVSFDTNGGTGSMPDQTFAYEVPQALNAHAFEREGFGFTGWNTAADGTGTGYTDGQTISITADLTLYAQWKANVHTITFIANGGAGNMDAEEFDFGTTMNLTANAFTREGHRFTGWNTAADGSGTAYADSASVTINTDLTLYAQWEAYTYTVRFDANGGAGSMGDQSFTYGVFQALSAHSFTREGYGFTGWNTEPGGLGDSFTDGQSISVTSDLTLYAQWSANVHTVAFISNGGSGTMDAESFDYGQTLTLTANAFTRSGYEFTGWNTAADGSGTPYGNEAEVTISEDLTLYAQWTAVVYRLSYNLEGGSLDGSNPASYTMESEDITLINPTRDGYTFAGWHESVSGKTELTVTIAKGSTGNRVYTARWTAVSYTVHFDANGGEGTMADQSFTYDVSQALTLNSYKRTGYSFLGWNTEADGSGTNYSDGESVHNLSRTDGAVVMLYACWTQNPTHTITFDANDGSGDQYQQTVEDSLPTTLTPNMFERTGHEFTGWNTAADGSGEDYADGASVTLTEDLTLYAQWEVFTYTVRFDANGGEGSMSDQSFTYGVPQSLSTHSFTREGYGFTGWNTAADGTGTGYTDGETISVTSDMTLYAQWAANIHTVTFIANGGEGTMAAENFSYGTTRNLTMNSFFRTGYSFSGWNTKADGSGDAYANGAFVKITVDLTLYAQWTANVHTVTFIANGGEGTMAAETFEYGQTLNLTANVFTRAGYSFTGWNTAADGSGDAYADGASVTITEDLTLYAQWTVFTYTVRFDANSGEGTMSDQSFTYGVPQSLSTHSFTREGYGFTGWNTAADGTGTGYTDGETISVTSDMTLYAQWAANVHTITFIANGGEGTMAAENFEYGQTLNLTANAFTRAGYTFTGWNTAADGSGDAYADGASVTITEDLTLYAQWTKSSFNISITAGEHGTVQALSGGTPVQSALPGEEITLIVTPNEGYELHLIRGMAGSQEIPLTKIDENTYIFFMPAEAVTIETVFVSADPEAAVIKSDPQGADDLVYTGEIQDLLLEAGEVEGGTILYSVNGGPYTAELPQGLDAGTYTITWYAMGDENHKNNGSPDDPIETLTITIAPKPVTVTADDKSKIEGQADPELTATVEGLIGSDIISYTLYREPGETAGTYDIIPLGESSQGNYLVTFVTGEFTITPVGSAVIITYPQGAVDLSFTGHPMFLLSEAGEVEGGTILYSVNGGPYTTELPQGIETGNYTITWYVAGDETHGDLGSPEEPFGTITVTISPADGPKEPMDLPVKIYFIKKDGSRGVPEDIDEITLNLTLKLKGTGGSAKSEAIRVEVNGGMRDIELDAVAFDDTPPGLLSEYEVIVEGLPASVHGKAPVNQRYRLTAHAWVNNLDGITIEIFWDDGKYHGPEEPYFFPLPEDEIGAYKQDPWGNKTYLLFHTYEICMRWLGSDELCSGYERCFHKELPYVYDKDKIRVGYDWVTP